MGNHDVVRPGSRTPKACCTRRSRMLSSALVASSSASCGFERCIDRLRQHVEQITNLQAGFVSLVQDGLCW
jgi:hypothetical protein